MKYWLCFEKLGLFESFRRPWVCCKSRIYWGFELSHSMKSETHHPFVPVYYSLVILKTPFLSFVPFTTVCCISKKKNCVWNRKIGDPHGMTLPPRFPNIRLTVNPNRTQKSVSVYPNKGPSLPVISHKPCGKDFFFILGVVKQTRKGSSYY